MGQLYEPVVMTKDAKQNLVLPSSLERQGYFLVTGNYHEVLRRESAGLGSLFITLCFGSRFEFFLRMFADVAALFIHGGRESTYMYNMYISRQRSRKSGPLGSLWASRRYPTVDIESFLKDGFFVPPDKGGYWIASFQTCIALFEQHRQHIEEELTAKGFVYRILKDRIAFSNLESVSKGFPPGVYELMRFKPSMIEHFMEHRGKHFGSLADSFELEDYINRYATQYSGMIEDPLSYDLFQIGEVIDDRFEPAQLSESESD